MQKGITIGIITAAVIISGVLASPLFYETEVNESLPVSLNEIEEGLTYEMFTEMDDSKRDVLVEQMSTEVQEMIMEKASTVIIPISQTMPEPMEPENSVVLVKSGMFVGLAGHNAEGIAKIIQVNDMTFLRFEDFEVTNGPDLRVYITLEGDVKNGIHLEKLKGSKGDQNYSLEGIDLDAFDSVVIYCQPFGVYFGEAKLA